jgi:heavy metal translocating P-type ATPase
MMETATDRSGMDHSARAAAIRPMGALQILRDAMTPPRWLELSRIGGTGLITLLYWRHVVPEWVLLIAVAVGLYPLLKIGLIDLVRHRKLGTEMFVSLATIIALASGETVAGSVIMVIILIAEFIAELNTDRARASIKSLIGTTPQIATVRENGAERTVSIAQLRVGDVVLVRAGEKIPIDGAVVAGAAFVNEAPITGVSIPREKTAGGEVFAGTVLESGALDIRTQRVGADTTFARIIQLVERAQEHQAPVQKLTDKVAAWLIPVVLVFLTAVYLLTRDTRLIVTLLIFTSPAELGLATPLVMVSAIARSARSGVLVKGGIYLELLAKVDVMVFDKTGTLTTGRPQVTNLIVEPGVDPLALLRLAAAADRRSSHPLALAVIGHAAEQGVAYPEPEDFQTLQGRGVRAVVEGQVVLLGTEALLLESGIQPPAVQGQAGQTYVYAAAGGRAMGIFYFADRIRPEAREAIAQLKAGGVRQVVMLTGDNASTAQAVGRALGIDAIHADLLPQDKVKAIEELRGRGHRVAMIGDGINDAPALAAADIGVAMGGGGTQAAIEAADVALMTDDLSKIVLARVIARRAYRTIQENLFFGIGVVHVAGIAAALAGLIGPVAAALLHLGPDVLVFLNSVKLLRVRLRHNA